MAESSAVVAKTLATAAQYNNLRNDVLSTTLGHRHDGTNGREHLEIVFTTGVAVTGSQYSIGKDDSTVLHLNGPTGSTLEYSINDAAVLTANTTALTLADGVELNLQEGVVWTAAGPAVTAADYSLSRDDGNVMHLNVPTGSSYELSVNDTAIVTATATAVTFADTCYPVLPTPSGATGTVKGSIWVDEDDNNLFFYNGSEVRKVASGLQANHRIWIPAHSAYSATAAASTLSNHPTMLFEDGVTDDLYMTLLLPFTPSEVTLSLVALGTGNAYLSADTTWGSGAGSEDYNNDTDSIADTAVALTANRLATWSLGNAFTNALGNDIVGLHIERQGGHASDTIGAAVHIVGVWIDP